MSNTFYIVIHTLLMLSSAAARQIQPRVVGGREDVYREFPFAVMIQFARPPMLRTCSGSLIAPNWVLTAGHCVPTKGLQRIRVKYGDPTIPSNETKFFAQITKGMRHPSYKPMQGTMNDIGLLKIKTTSNPALAKLSAVDYASFIGLPVKYAGFGWTRLLGKGETPPKEPDLKDDLEPPILVGEALVISCRQDEGFGWGRPGICLAPRCGPRQHPYFGDSGGPLMLYGRIIGVASGCRELEPPIVNYTPVSPYLKWIHDTIQSD